MSIHGVLGESTQYPKTYQPQALYAISRELGREQIGGNTDRLNLGVDWWQAFEVSWLNPQGISQVAIARFSVPADSLNIIESKSLKLYLNSLNFTAFPNWHVVEQTISTDLSRYAEAPVTVELFDLQGRSTDTDNPIKSIDAFSIEPLQGESIDNALNGTTEKLPLLEHPDASLLGDKLVKSAQVDQDKTNNNDSGEVQDYTGDVQDYKLYSNLLRSNCPVTDQPDWGAVAIEISTATPIDKGNLLKYILSYRQHNGFHEQCVEQVFSDLSDYFTPTKLMVRAWYTRRGGIDINPCRVSDMALLPKPSRLIRQ